MARVDRWEQLGMDTRLAEVFKLYSNRADTKHVAEYFGVSEQTIYNWQKDKPEFNEARLNGLRSTKHDIEKVYHKLAFGYTEVLNKVKVMPDGSLCQYQEEIVYPPNERALRFLMKNKFPEEYRERHEIKHEGAVETTISTNLSQLSVEDLRRLVGDEDEAQGGTK